MSVDMLEELRQTGAPFGDRAEAAVNVNSILQKTSLVYNQWFMREG